MTARVARQNAQTGPKRISAKRIIAALERNAGIVAAAARDLGIDRSGLHRRIRNSDELSSALLEIEEMVLDAANGLIKQAILRDGDVRIACWYVAHKERASRAKSDYLPDAVLQQIVTAVSASQGEAGLRELRRMIAGS